MGLNSPSKTDQTLVSSVTVYSFHEVTRNTSLM